MSVTMQKRRRGRDQRVQILLPLSSTSRHPTADYHASSPPRVFDQQLHTSTKTVTSKELLHVERVFYCLRYAAASQPQNHTHSFYIVLLVLDYKSSRSVRASLYYPKDIQMAIRMTTTRSGDTEEENQLPFPKEINIISEYRFYCRMCL